MNILKEVAQNLAMGFSPIRRLARLRHRTGINRDAALVATEYAFLRGYGPVKDTRILEVGPGQTPDLLLRALADGAAMAAAADITDYLSGDGDTRRIEYRVFDGQTLPFGERGFDWVWAIDVFEHVRHPARMLEEVFRVLSPGGQFVCKIDLRDHFFLADEERWLECLQYDRRVWSAMTWNRSNFVNRWRLSDWTRAFVATGFQVVDQKLHRSERLLATRENRPFLQRHSVEDVATYRIDACLRRPK